MIEAAFIERERFLLAAMKFAFLSTRGVIGLDNDQNARLCEARDRLNRAMTTAGFDWSAPASTDESLQGYADSDKAAV